MFNWKISNKINTGLTKINSIRSLSLTKPVSVEVNVFERKVVAGKKTKRKEVKTTKKFFNHSSAKLDPCKIKLAAKKKRYQWVIR